ncbi:PIN domain [Phaffia rhodozyma]|uniref:PIN domain n=1 Tax=Phaffia rhodozyma TaxID=264483 RepID=A0A0F7SSI6_PHARH|nr:PIN domain [Phaffia rhodozyma]
MRTDSPSLPKPNKALAAAFLAHQVEELQQQIQDINVGSNYSSPPSFQDRHSGSRTRGSDRAGLLLIPGGTRGGRGSRHGSDSTRPSGRQEDGVPGKTTRIIDTSYTKSPQLPPSPSILLRNPKGVSASTSVSIPGSSVSPQIRGFPLPAVTASSTMSMPPGNGPVVVDGSALIWALPSVKRILARREREIIIPAEVLHTLDLLKKGSSALPQAVRIATRFVETHLSISNSINPSHQSFRGLRVARPSERTDVPDIACSDDTPPMDNWLRSIIGTVLYLAQPPASSSIASSSSIPSSSSSKPILLISSPLAGESLGTDEDGGFESDKYDHTVRASGEDVGPAAEKYGVETFWIAPSLISRSGFGGGNGRGGGGRGGCGFDGGGEGRGRGRGGGRARGRDHRSRNEALQEPPKIVLLKRPA